MNYRLLGIAFGLFLIGGSPVFAYSTYLTDVPNTDVNSCYTCHNNPSGGTGCGGGTGYPTSPYGSCLNIFGKDFRDVSSRTWNTTLRDRDSDGDGRTNGQELVYFGSSYSDGASGQGSNTYVTRPGAASSRHTNECYLQSTGTWGFTYHPRNYTNCSTSSAATCTNNTSSAVPSGRYFGFTCGCDPGYSGNGRRDVSGDGVADGGANGCSDVNECASSLTCRNYHSSNYCFNNSGGYNCICGAGFTEVNSGTLSENCNDINECSTWNRCLRQYVANSCTNYTGSYNCSCGAGFTEINSGTLTENCQDVNECAPSNACLRQYAANSCSNSTGSYNCSCGAGFTEINSGTLTENCQDVNECAPSNACLRQYAANSCSNSTGSYNCSCGAGFTEINSGTLTENCQDVNECSSGTRCLQNYAANSCSNSTGSYNCSCGAGFTEINSGTLTENCQDVNECNTATTCNANLGYGSCTNTTGGYNCICEDGYQQSGSGLSLTCVDINECNASTTCNANLGYGSCTNTTGGYNCTCNPGYGFDGTTCVLDNECTTGADDCNENATCTDPSPAVGDFICTLQSRIYRKRSSP